MEETIKHITVFQTDHWSKMPLREKPKDSKKEWKQEVTRRLSRTLQLDSFFPNKHLKGNEPGT